MANAAMYVGHFLKLILILLLSRTAQYDDANNCDMNCEECTVSHHFLFICISVLVRIILLSHDDSKHPLQ